MTRIERIAQRRGVDVDIEWLLSLVQRAVDSVTTVRDINNAIGLDNRDQIYWLADYNSKDNQP